MLNRLEKQKLRDLKIRENLENIKYVIGVYSGKGGVGKTTIAVNIAATLAKKGYKVGLFDVDIDCPNIPKILGLKGPLRVTPDKRLLPVEKYGMKIISTGLITEDETQPIIWRGPLITNAIFQFMEDVEWGELDFLIMDFPPGTSDAPLTIMQNIPLNGMIFVATPQKLSLLDVKKAIRMAEKLHIKITGIVENMSNSVFGTGAAEEVAKEFKVPFLGRVTLRESISRYSDEGVPPVLKDENVRKEFEQIIDNMMKYSVSEER